MPIYWGEQETASGARLPFTEVRVGDIALRFNGRPGARLREAVAHLEREARRLPLSLMAKVRKPSGKVRGPQKPKRGPRR